MNTLIVDIGTSSMRGILFTEQGERLLTAYDLCEQELKEAAERLFARHLAPFAAPGGPEAGKEL